MASIVPFALSLVVGLSAQDTARLSIEAAVRRANDVSPSIAAAVSAQAAPLALRRETWWPFPENPVLELGRVRRHAPTSMTYDRQWSITQPIEVAGQGVIRASHANALIRAAGERTADSRRLASQEVRNAYAMLAIAEDRVALTDSAAAFAARMEGIADKLEGAGEINRIERNVATLDAARARGAADLARARLHAASVDVSRLLALPSDSAVRTTPLTDAPVLQWRSDAALVAVALARRPDRRAGGAAVAGAERGVLAARLGAVPNLTVGVSGGREGGTDDLLGFSIGVDIPLIHRRQADVGLAVAERGAARAGLVATRRLIEAEVLAASARYVLARTAERRFAGGVLARATENVALTERALAEGEVSITDVLILRSATVATQLEYLDVRQELLRAWFDLAAALAADPEELPLLLAEI